MQTKRFPLRVILAVTTGRLLTEKQGPKDNGIGDLYAILGWMTNDTPFTHQLGRFGEECKPWLLRWFPELASADCNALDELRRLHGVDAGVEAWLRAVESSTNCATEYDVPQIPQDRHTRKDAYDELVEMRGTEHSEDLPGRRALTKKP